MTKRTRYICALAATIRRAVARLDHERGVPPKQVKKRGTGDRHQVPAEWEQRSKVPFWEAVLVCLESLLDSISTTCEPDDPRLDRYLELGPWDAMVTIARKATGLPHYAEAVIAHAALLQTARMRPGWQHVVCAEA